MIRLKQVLKLGSLLLRKIQLQVNELDDSRYANAFPLPTSEGAQPFQGIDGVAPADMRNKTRKNPRKIGQNRIVNSVLISENFEVAEASSGFSVRPSKLSNLEVGDKFIVKAGYDLSAGNPLGKSAIDFEIVNRLSTNTGVSVVSADGNFITFSVTSKKFECSFENFDIYRDLVVGVNDVN